MRYIKLWGPNDEEILISMSVKVTEAEVEGNYFKDWMESRIAWGYPFLAIAGIVTVSSVITMIIKWL